MTEPIVLTYDDVMMVWTVAVAIGMLVLIVQACIRIEQGTVEDPEHPDSIAWDVLIVANILFFAAIIVIVGGLVQ